MSINTSIQQLKDKLIDLNPNQDVTFKTSNDTKMTDVEAQFMIKHANNLYFRILENDENFILDLESLTDNEFKIIDIEILEDIPAPEELKIIDEIDEEGKVKSEKNIEFSLEEELEDYVETREYEQELSIWEINWNFEELRESLISDLMELDSKKYKESTRLFDKNFNRSESILNHSNRIYNQFLNNNSNVLFNDDYKSYIHRFNNNHYSTEFIKPIVYDIKKIYTENAELLPKDEGVEDDDEHQMEFPQVSFIDFNKEMEINTSLIIKYYKHKKKNDETSDIINHQTYLEFLEKGGDIYLEEQNLDNENTGITSDRHVFFETINNPYINKLNNISDDLKVFITEPIQYDEKLTRLCNPKNKCFSMKLNSQEEEFSSIPTNSFEIKHALSGAYAFEDVLSDRAITDRKGKQSSIQTCNGTNKTGDSFYAGLGDRKTFNQSDFNKSIASIPLKKNIVEGEKLNIVGFFLKSINEINITNKEIYFISEKQDRVLQYFPKINNQGYNLYDFVNFNNNAYHNIYNTKNIINNLDIHNNIINLDSNQLDYSKNNYILFKTNNENTYLTREQINSYLNNILPSIPKIFDLEHVTISKCNNFESLNRILSKYNLDYKCINANVREKLQISRRFITNRDKYLKHITYQEYKKLKAIKNNNELSKLLLDIRTLKNIYSKTLNYTNFQSYKNNLLDIVSSQIFSIYKSYKLSKLENFIFNLNFNINYPIELINEQEKKQFIIKKLVEIVIFSKKNNIHHYSNSIVNIIKNDGLLPKLKPLLQKIIEITNLNIISNNNKYYNNTNLTKSDLQTIHLFKNSTMSMDNGILIKKFLRLVSCEDTFQTLLKKLNMVAKTHYSEDDEWNDLLFLDKIEWLENSNIITNFTDKLDLYKTIFNQEKEKYDYYVNRCNSFKISKIFNSENDLKMTNNQEDIYYDPNFDTTEIDIKIAKDLLIKQTEKGMSGNIMEQSNIKSLISTLKDLYLFDSDAEIIDKKDSVIRNFNKDEPRRLIKNGDYCLLIKNGGRFLFIRKENMWSILGKTDITSHNRCILEEEEFKSIIDIPFEDLIAGVETDNLSRKKSKCISIDNEDIKSYISQDINNNIAQEISNKSNFCIPKILIPHIIKIKNLYDEVIELKNLSKNLYKTNNSIKNLTTKIDSLINEYNILNQNKIKKDTEEVKDITNKHKIPMALKNKYIQAINISDGDVRLTEIDNVINSYGRFSKPNSSESEDFIYWDYQDTSEKLCCIHYLDLVKIAWKENHEKNNMIKNIVQNFQGGIDGSRVICKICGETLDHIKYSDFEGFSSDDKPLIFREKVIETSQDKTIVFTEQEEEIYQKLIIITKELGVNLLLEDINYIVTNTVVYWNKIMINLFEYFSNKSKELINTIKSKSKKNSIKLGLTEFLETYLEVNENTINQSKSGTGNIKNFYQFFYNPRGPVKTNYKIYYENNQISILLSYLVVVLSTNIPGYTIKGTGDERVAKLGLSFVGDFYQRTEEGIHYLLDIVNKLRKSWNYIYPLKNDSQKASFKKKFFNSIYQDINEQYTVLDRKREKEEDIDILIELQELDDLSSSSWPSFRPNLQLDLTYNPSINIISTISNYQQYKGQYFELLKKKNHNPDSFLQDDIISQISSRLLLIENIMINKSRQLGNKLITLINSEIRNSIQSFSYNISYVGNCCTQDIKNNYLQDFLSKNSNIQSTYNSITQLEKFIKQFVFTKNNNITFNSLNTNNYIIPIANPKTRKFLDYMYISEDIFDTDEDYRKYLIKKFKQINYIVVTNLFQISGINEILGKRRVFKNVIDKDIYMLDELYEELGYDNDVEIKLRLHENITLKYPDFSPEYVERKINNLINYGGIVEEDVVTGQYKHEIRNLVENFVKEKTSSQLYEKLQELEKFLKIKKKIDYTNDELFPDIESKYLYEIEIIESIELKLNELFGKFEDKEISTFAKSNLNELLKETSNSVITQNRKSKIQGSIRNLFSNLQEETNENFNIYCEFLNYIDSSNSVLDYKRFYDELSIDNRENRIYKRLLDNTLKIEGYTGTQLSEEKLFRLRELYNKEMEGIKLVNLKNYIKSILSNITSIYTKYQSRKFNQINFDKNKGMLNSLENDIRMHIAEFLTLKYQEQDELLNEIIELSEENSGKERILIESMETILHSSNKINQLLDLITSWSNEYQCRYIQVIHVLQPEFIIIILEYILSMILLEIIKTFTEDSSNNRANELLEKIIRKNVENITLNENITKTIDIDIEQGIKNYKSKQNRMRKAKFESLTSELKGVQKLYRRFNLGDIFSSYDEGDSTEQIFNHSGEIITDGSNELSDEQYFEQLDIEATALSGGTIHEGQDTSDHI